MALPTYAIYEIRNDGSDLNAGFFHPYRTAAGTDYSQQAAPEHAYTDLVIDAANNLKVSSVLRPFLAADVGNGLRISGGTGFTAGLYEIVSVAAGVATLDRTVGTLGSVGGVGRLGGAIASLTRFKDDHIAQNTAWLRGASGVFPAQGLTFASGGSVTYPFWTRMFGYGTVRGDDGKATVQAPTAGPAAVIGLGAPGSGCYHFRNLIFDANNLVNNALNMNNGSEGALFENCVFQNGTATGCRSISSHIRFFNCLFQDNAGPGFEASVASFSSLGFDLCVFRRNTGANGHGAYLPQTAILTRCLSYGNAQHGFYFPKGTRNQVTLLQCVSAYNGGDGLRAADNIVASGNGDLALFWALGCIFAKNGGYAVQMQNTAASIVSPGTPDDHPIIQSFNRQFRCCVVWDNALGVSNDILPTNWPELALSQNPFAADVATTFNLALTGPGAAAIEALPCPGNYPDGVNTASFPPGASGAIPEPTSTAAGDLISLWRELTGEQDTEVVTDTQVALYIDGGAQELNRRTQINTKESTTALTLVAKRCDYPAPEDLVEILLLEVIPGKPLVKMDYDEWRRRQIQFRNEPPGTPNAYYLDGRTLIVSPPPSEGFVADYPNPFLRYVAAPESIVTADLNLNTQDRRLPVYHGVAEYSAANPDGPLADERAKTFFQLFQAEAALMAGEHAGRKVDR